MLDEFTVDINKKINLFNFDVVKIVNDTVRCGKPPLKYEGLVFRLTVWKPTFWGNFGTNFAEPKSTFGRRADCI